MLLLLDQDYLFSLFFFFAFSHFHCFLLLTHPPTPSKRYLPTLMFTHHCDTIPPYLESLLRSLLLYIRMYLISLCVRSTVPNVLSVLLPCTNYIVLHRVQTSYVAYAYCAPAIVFWSCVRCTHWSTWYERNEWARGMTVLILLRFIVVVFSRFRPALCCQERMQVTDDRCWI